MNFPFPQVHIHPDGKIQEFVVNNGQVEFGRFIPTMPQYIGPHVFNPPFVNNQSDAFRPQEPTSIPSSSPLIRSETPPLNSDTPSSTVVEPQKKKRRFLSDYKVQNIPDGLPEEWTIGDLVQLSAVAKTKAARVLLERLKEMKSSSDEQNRQLSEMKEKRKGKAEYDDLMQDFNNMRASATERANQISDLKDENRTLESSKKELSAKNKELTMKLEEMEKKMRTMEENEMNMIKLGEQLTEVITRLKKEKKILEENVKNLDKEDEKMKEMKKTNEEMEKQLKDEMEKNKRIEEALNTKEQEESSQSSVNNRKTKRNRSKGKKSQAPVWEYTRILFLGSVSVENDNGTEIALGATVQWVGHEPSGVRWENMDLHLEANHPFMKEYIKKKYQEGVPIPSEIEERMRKDNIPFEAWRKEVQMKNEET